MCLFSFNLSHCLVNEAHLWSKEYLVAIYKHALINTIALINNAVQTFSIFDQPGAIFPTNFGMESRNALGRNRYIVPAEATNCDDRFSKLVYTLDLPINL